MLELAAYLYGREYKLSNSFDSFVFWARIYPNTWNQEQFSRFRGHGLHFINTLDEFIGI